MTFLINLKAISVNHAYGYNPKTNRRYLVSEGVMFKNSVAYLVKSQLPKGYKINPDDSFNVKISFHFEDKRRRDVDDYFKLLIDALTGILWKDDSQIILLTGVKVQPAEGDFIMLEVDRY